MLELVVTCKHILSNHSNNQNNPKYGFCRDFGVLMKNKL